MIFKKFGFKKLFSNFDFSVSYEDIKRKIHNILNRYLPLNNKKRVIDRKKVSYLFQYFCLIIFGICLSSFFVEAGYYEIDSNYTASSDPCLAYTKINSSFNIYQSFTLNGNHDEYEFLKVSLKFTNAPTNVTISFYEHELVSLKYIYNYTSIEAGWTNFSTPGLILQENVTYDVYINISSDNENVFLNSCDDYLSGKGYFWHDYENGTKTWLSTVFDYAFSMHGNTANFGYIGQDVSSGLGLESNPIPLLSVNEIYEEMKDGGLSPGRLVYLWNPQVQPQMIEKFKSFISPTKFSTTVKDGFELIGLFIKYIFRQPASLVQI